MLSIRNHGGRWGWSSVVSKNDMPGRALKLIHNQRWAYGPLQKAESTYQRTTSLVRLEKSSPLRGRSLSHGSTLPPL